MRIFTLFLVALSISFNIFAQSTITGKVVDESGNPIPNVSVQVKNTKSGTISNNDGFFSIAVSPSAKALLFSSIGWEDLELKLSGATTYTVQLVSKSKNIDEVLVIGYGSTIKKSNFVGSSAQVNNKEFANRPLSNALNAIAGAGPGIQTAPANGAPGSAPAITIRGFGSYSLSNEPLYVVDGAIYSENEFANISPADIETITILKDATTTALYGSKGANGVVMVATKKAQRGRQSLQFSAKFGVSNAALAPYETVSPQEYYALAWESYRNNLHLNTSIPLDSANLIASGLLPRYTTGANIGKQNYKNKAYQDIFQVLGNYNPFNVGNTEIVGIDGKINPNAALLYADDLNWIDQSTRTGKRSEYNVQFSSNNEKSDITASIGYVRDEGWGLRSKLDRFNARINATVTPVKWFRSGVILSGAKTTSNTASTTTAAIANTFSFSRNIAPIYPVHLYKMGTNEKILDAKGNPIFDVGNTDGFARPYNAGRHPIAEHLWDKKNIQKDVLSARAFGEITLKPWLKFTTNISYDVVNKNEDNYDNQIVGDGAPAGRLNVVSNNESYYTFNQLFNINKTIGLHAFDAVIGHENYDFKETQLTGSKTTQSFEDVIVFSNFTTISNLGNSLFKRRSEGYLSRINYSYDNKYLFSASFRRDGNSLFPPSVRWANFWSVGGAWKISAEPFFNLKWVNLLKIKTSYGIVGNSNLASSYSYQSGYTTGRDDDTRAGTYFTSFGSDSLTWETQKPFDLGVEFSMFKNRLSGSIEYFNRISSGLIFEVPQPLQYGGRIVDKFEPLRNVGNMRNRGVEVQLSGNIVHTKDFDWTLTINATHYKNEILQMPKETPILQSGPFQREAKTSIRDFFTRIYYGVDTETGLPLFKGVKIYDSSTLSTTKIIKNPSGGYDTLTTDHNNALFQYTGHSAIPDLFGSIKNDFSYKNFELSFMLTYQIGGYVYDNPYATLMTSLANGSNYHKDQLNSWSTNKTKSNLPRLDADRGARFTATNTRFITNASYLTLNNLTLGYRIPNTISNKLNIGNARVYVSGENLMFFTKRKGLNPNGVNSDGEFTGQVVNTYNPARVLNIGLTINF